MRRRIPYRVCRCMPNGVLTHLEARMLRTIVNREIHPIRCAASCKRKFQKGMYIGDLCAETGHFLWALKVWSFTASQIENKDNDDWLYVWFNPKWVELTDVISETEYELLKKRCGHLYQALGFPEDYWWSEHQEHIASRSFGTSYHYLFGENYDSNYYPDQIQAEWEEEMKKCQSTQETETLFAEAMGEDMAQCSQDFFAYWHSGSHGEIMSRTPCLP